MREGFVRIHGQRKALRAEFLALVLMCRAVYLASGERRERCERVFYNASEEASTPPPERQPGAPADEGRDEWRNGWPPYVWGALERLGEAGRTEAEWLARLRDACRGLAAIRDESEAQTARREWRGGW